MPSPVRRTSSRSTTICVARRRIDGRGVLFLDLPRPHHARPEDQERQGYACDVTYGTNNEFGFDYLRDNMKFRIEEMVQREFHFAITTSGPSSLMRYDAADHLGPAEDAAECGAAPI